MRSRREPTARYDDSVSRTRFPGHVHPLALTPTPTPIHITRNAKGRTARRGETPKKPTRKKNGPLRRECVGSKRNWPRFKKKHPPFSGSTSLSGKVTTETEKTRTDHQYGYQYGGYDKSRRPAFGGGGFRSRPSQKERGTRRVDSRGVTRCCPTNVLVGSSGTLLTRTT